MHPIEAFWRAVESEAEADDPAGGALYAAHAALARLDAGGADEALARVDSVPAEWAPVWRCAQVMRAARSPDHAALAAAAVDLEGLLEGLEETDPSAPRVAHLLGSLELRLAHAAEAERAATRALELLPIGALHRAAWALDTLATAYARQGAWHEARRTYAATVAQKRALGDALGVAISAGSWGRMELDLDQAAEASLIAEEADHESLPALTRLRLTTLALEAAEDAGDAVRSASARERLAEQLVGVDEAHHLAGYALVALARHAPSRGLDPRPLLERARGSLQLALGASLLAYWERRLLPDPRESDEAWLARLEPAFAELGVCTLPEALARLHVAERQAVSDRPGANAALDALAVQIAATNNPMLFRRLDVVGDAIDPRAAARRRLARYLGPNAGELERTVRLDATLVFADLVGFTRRSVELSPEAVMETVRSVFELAAAPLLEQGLEPLQHLGDGLLAIGLGEDHAARGLAFARAFTARMRRVSAARAASGAAPTVAAMNVRCGVATGPVVLGPIGSLVRTEHLAIGLTTNRAARLQGFAAPDEVVCDAAMTTDGERFEVEAKGIGVIAARRLRL